LIEGRIVRRSRGFDSHHPLQPESGDRAAHQLCGVPTSRSIRELALVGSCWRRRSERPRLSVAGVLCLRPGYLSDERLLCRYTNFCSGPRAPVGCPLLDRNRLLHSAAASRFRAGR